MRPSVQLLLLAAAAIAPRADAFNLFGSGAPDPEDNFELLVLHNNDMHARFEQTAPNSGTCPPGRRDCVGGMARTAHEVRRYRRMADEGTGRPVIYLNAGDTYVGTVWFTIFKAEIAVDFLNLLRPDAMSLGNHEFDLGPAGLLPLLKGVKFPIVVANVNFTGEPTLPPLPKSTLITLKNRTVAIIGHLTPQTAQISLTGRVAFTPVVDAVRAEAERLTAAGIKIIIACGHSGFDTDKEIALKVPQIDAVIGGHTNTFQWNGPQPDLERPEDLYPTVITQNSGKKVPVVQAYAYTKYLGRLNLTFDGNGDLIEFDGQPELLGNEIEQDADILARVEHYRPQIAALNGEVVGKTRVVLDSHNCRVEECNFGNLIADSMVAYVAGNNVAPAHSWTGTPIGLMNGGGIRNTIDKGDVTRGDLLGVLPFSNQLLVFELSGASLRRVLETAVRGNGETSKGEFMQVSGVRVTYDRRKRAGQRVVAVRVRCGNCTVPAYEPLDEAKRYGVVTTSFLAYGGDNYGVLRDEKIEPVVVQDLNDVEEMVWYFAKYSPVYPEIEGRIQFVGSGAGRGMGTLVVAVLAILARFFEG